MRQKKNLNTCTQKILIIQHQILHRLLSNETTCQGEEFSLDPKEKIEHLEHIYNSHLNNNEKSLIGYRLLNSFQHCQNIVKEFNFTAEHK